MIPGKCVANVYHPIGITSAKVVCHPSVTVRFVELSHLRSIRLRHLIDQRPVLSQIRETEIERSIASESPKLSPTLNGPREVRDPRATVLLRDLDQ